MGLTLVSRLDVSDALSVAIIAVTASLLWASPEMRRPLQLDELSTVERYTWAGVTPTGEMREIRRISDFHALPTPGLRHLAIGVYCAAGRWTEPGNHILNSLLTNFVLAFSRSEAAVRIPALAGFVAFALLLHLFLSRSLGWHAAAPVLVASIVWLPYLTRYAMTSRGYTWMLALQVLLLLGLHRLARTPASVLWGTVCAGAAVLSFMNTVHLMADWVFPIYALLLLVPSLHHSTGTVESRLADTAAWRRNILVQALGIGAVGAVFVVDRLPYIYSSSQQYGIPTTTFGAFTENTTRIMRELLGSEAGLVLGLAGIAGIVAFCALGRHRLLAWVCIATVSVSGVHFFLTRTLPPPRTCGFLLILPMIGLGFLLQRFLGPASAFRTRAAVASLCVVAAASLALSTMSRLARDTEERNAFWAGVRSFSVPGLLTYPFIPNDSVNLIRYSPEDWLDEVSVLPVGRAMQMCVFTNPAAYEGGIRLRGLRGSTSMRHAVRAGLISDLDDAPAERVWYPAAWEGEPPGGLAGRQRLVRVMGRTESLAEAVAHVPERALVFWYPDPETLGLAAEELLAHVDDYELRYMMRSAGFQAKLDWYSRLALITFVGETREQCETIFDAVHAGHARFGGDIVVFRPLPSAPVVNGSH